MAKITYTDKETLNEIPSIPAKNKVQASDMNEIKNAVNQNELKILLIVDSSAPAECSTGDMYYNTTTKLIYTATGTNTWDSTGVNPTQNTLYIDYTNKSTYFYDGTDLISVGGGAGGESLKIGTIVPFAGSTIPDGYLTCDGTAVSRTTYSDLFAVIGTTYGSGDGSTTFNLPNLKGRVPVGLDGTDTDFDTLGETGGSKTHNHTLENGYAGIGMYQENNATNVYKPKSGATFTGTKYTNGGSTGEGGTSTLTTVNASQLLGTTDNESSLQPYLVVHYIIKATKTTPIQAEIVNSYSTSTTDGYSCDYINDLVEDVYSTDEVKTNKVWIDGKPIYRKVIAYSGTALANGATSLAHNVSNIGTYRNIKEYQFYYQGAMYAGYQNATFSATVVSIDSTNVSIYINGWGNLFETAYITIEYTKTTD